MRAGTLLCTGCNCRTQAVDADPEAHNWPFCDHFPAGVPCRYAAIFRCLIKVSSTNSYGNPLVVACPVVELKKECFVGCKWVARTVVGSPLDCDGIPSLVDVTTDAIPNAFPPAHLTDGALGYHKGDYRTDAACLAPVAGSVGWESYTDQWTLEIVSPTEVTLTFTNATILAGAERSTIPVYRNVREWDPFAPRPDGPVADARGGNEMVLDAETSRDWPELPHAICIVTLDEPGGLPNPCGGDRAAQRICCDKGGDDGFLDLLLTGCSTLAGLHRVNFTRITSAGSLPCGVSMPAGTDCGVFWGTLGTGGDGCTGTEGEQWSGNVGFLVYCDPAAEREDGGPPLSIKAHCFDGYTDCWVEAVGAAEVTLTECRCDGAYLEVTLTDLPCCCPSAPPIETDCCDAVPATLTVIATLNGVTREFTITYDAGSGRWKGAESGLNAVGLGAQLLPGLSGNPFYDACLFQLTCWNGTERTGTLSYDWATADPAKTILMTSFGSYLKAATCSPFYLKWQRTESLFPFNGDCNDTANYQSGTITIEVME